MVGSWSSVPRATLGDRVGPMSERPLWRGKGAGMGVLISQGLRAAPAVKFCSTSGVSTCLGRARSTARKGPQADHKVRVVGMVGTEMVGPRGDGACSTGVSRNPQGYDPHKRILRRDLGHIDL